jgi:hypothetical protein
MLIKSERKKLVSDKISCGEKKTGMCVFLKVIIIHVTDAFLKVGNKKDLLISRSFNSIKTPV